MTEEQDEHITDKIIGVLKIYPKISPSMMQIGIGSSLPTSIWKPVLEDLIERKIVVRDVIVALSASSRNQSYTVLSLADNTYNEHSEVK